MSVWRERRQPLPLPTREEATRFAIASTVMEGETVSEDTACLLTRWDSGEITGAELVEHAKALEPEMAAAPRAEHR